ncbi:hypothetical protein PoB_001291800 [Plakobranchus ocellatus]|uniref:Uncharacterized protein n=1 Tax=Plakobranchus ocellatus TaxID=259542 RepID=A0AAV3YVJ9_9GAST|nr:hypothetical protein PoB_001291800 [Plakobranchus ocellatus]
MLLSLRILVQHDPTLKLCKIDPEDREVLLEKAAIIAKATPISQIMAMSSKTTAEDFPVNYLAILKHWRVACLLLNDIAVGSQRKFHRWWRWGRQPSPRLKDSLITEDRKQVLGNTDGKMLVVCHVKNWTNRYQGTMNSAAKFPISQWKSSFHYDVTSRLETSVFESETEGNQTCFPKLSHLHLSNPRVAFLKLERSSLQFEEKLRVRFNFHRLTFNNDRDTPVVKHFSLENLNIITSNRYYSHRLPTKI